MLNINTLVLEITRRCNMACAHCMRGEAENKDITHEIIDNALCNISDIGSLVFSGGEPTLNVDAIEYALKVCRDNDIYVGSFYIVTNAKDISDEFLVACIKWYAYIIECGGEPEMCGVTVSRDKYHEDVPQMNIDLLKGFSFFRENDKTTNWDKIPALNLGRARKLMYQEKRDSLESSVDVCKYEDSLEVRDTPISITVDGDILSVCDYEYSNTAAFKIGNVLEPMWTTAFEKLAS